MNISDEKKYLAGILKSLDRAPRGVQEHAIRRWPFIRPHLNRETIEARLAELDEREKNFERS